MAGLIHKLWNGLRTGGVDYLLSAPGNELRNPRCALTGTIRKTFIAIKSPFHRAGRAEGSGAWADDCLQFVYDLSIAPITFDFASHLAAAEVERRRRGLGGIVVIFVPDDECDTPKGVVTAAAPDIESRLFRVRHIMVPILALLPSVRGHVICGTRKQAEALLSNDENYLYPPDYRVFQPRQPNSRVIHDLAMAGEAVWPLLRSGEVASNFVSQFIKREAKGRLPVVIALRNSLHSPLRNSRVEEWVRFADWLDQDRFSPIFVLDTEAAMGPLEDGLERYIRCDAASWDVEIRMALFEQAWLNLATMNGSMELCWYNERARYLIFLETGNAAETMPEYLAESGYRNGFDLGFAKPGQHIAWSPDTFENIECEFNKMINRLDETDPEKEN